MRNISNATPIVVRMGGPEVRCVVEQDTGEEYIVALPFRLINPNMNIVRSPIRMW
jgi:hypothetical protein